MKREPVFSYQGWYPDSREAALIHLAQVMEKDASPKRALAAISPHAGWAFSGGVAGKVYSRIEIPERVVVLCPMHRAVGHPISIWDEGIWETPLGPMEVDEDFCRALMKKDTRVQVDFEAHRVEHAIEIQLPFIQHRNPQAKIVPLRLGHLDYESCLSLAESLAKTMEQVDGETLVVASSDMSHESSLDVLERNDALAIEKMMEMDAAGLHQVVSENDISMCGVIPVTVALETARLRGAASIEKVEYTNSAAISGRHDYIVGYFGAIVLP